MCDIKDLFSEKLFLGMPLHSKIEWIDSNEIRQAVTQVNVPAMMVDEQWISINRAENNIGKLIWLGGEPSWIATKEFCKNI